MPARSFVPQDTWIPRHQSFTQQIEGYYDFDAYGPNAGVADYKQVSGECQAIIAEAVQAHKTLRAMGSSWSLSKVGVAEHRLINTKNLRLSLAVADGFAAPGYAGVRENLRFFECGYSIAEINRELAGEGLSLKASGSNNGQTLPGVVSTNTHGSAFKFGATPENVVGIHLITGPSQQVYLERASYPVVTESFAQEKLGADLVRDDAKFNAALVSFGSFGIIRGMMIETRKLFLLHGFRSFRQFNPALKKAISALDFSDLDLHNKSAADLYHFQVTFNPNEGTPPNEAAVYLMFEIPWTDNYTPPDFSEDEAGPGAAGMEVMGELFTRLPNFLGNALKGWINPQVRNVLKPYEIKGAIKDIFRGEKTQGRTFASGIGLPLSRTLEALDIAFQAYANFGTVFPVLVTIRFVKGTKALLGFTKFDPTCVMEIDAINTDTTHQFATQVWTGIEQAGIPFTMHWGKFNSFLTRSRLDSMYGDNVNKWIASREALLTPEVRQVFTNDFLRGVGLNT